MRRGNAVLRRVFTAQPKLMTGLAALVISAVILGVIFSPAIVGASATVRLLPIYSVQRDNRACCLTFDAAWGNEDTQQLIDILETYQVKATFFVVGDWVDRYPESVKALFDAGMDIMNHSDTHPHCAAFSAGEIVSELTTCNNKIEAVTGVRPTLFRCPYGEYDDHVIAAVSGMGMMTIQWDVDSLDWKDYDAATIYERVTSRVQPGSIILFHNAALHTPEALPDIIEYLLANGYDIVKVSELLLTGDYTIDVAGRQCPVS